MAIQSKYDVVIELDGVEYGLTVSELTADQQKKLEKKFGKHTEALKDVQKLGVKIERAKERYAMLKESGETSKALEVLDKIEQLEEEIESAQPSIKASAEEIENILKDRLDMSVYGDDKDAFMAAVGAVNMFKEAFDEIARRIAESKRGKSNG